MDLFKIESLPDAKGAEPACRADMSSPGPCLDVDRALLVRRDIAFLLRMTLASGDAKGQQMSTKIRFSAAKGPPQNSYAGELSDNGPRKFWGWDASLVATPD
jgi:hypothetical protein